MTKSNPVSTGRRSVLSVPATDERIIGKALAAGADEVVIDLEDAVPAAAKDDARERLAAFGWGDHPRPRSVAVRVNAPGTPWFLRDLETLVREAVPVDSVVLPKVESRHDVRFAERVLHALERETGVACGIGLQALVETGAGVVNLTGIVAEPDRLTSLIVGYADLAADLGRSSSASPTTWLAVQTTVLVHARAAGLEAVDGPYLGVATDDNFMSEVETAAMLGFDAKWAIHPRQVPLLNDAFGPTEAAIADARRVLDALEAVARDGRGALQLDGMLIDEAMAVGARRVLAKVSR